MHLLANISGCITNPSEFVMHPVNRIVSWVSSMTGHGLSVGSIATVYFKTGNRPVPSLRYHPPPRGLISNKASSKCIVCFLEFFFSFFFFFLFIWNAPTFDSNNKKKKRKKRNKKCSQKYPTRYHFPFFQTLGRN